MKEAPKGKKPYKPPQIKRVKLEDKRGVGMATGCKFERTDESCYQDTITPIFDVSNPS